MAINRLVALGRALGVGVASVAIAAAGCDYDPLSSATQRTPDRSAVAGTWRLHKTTLAELRDEVKSRMRRTPSTLVLNGDGTFDARDVPDWWNQYYDHVVHDHHDRVSSNWSLTSASGKWALRRTSGTLWGKAWIVSVDFPELPGRQYPRGLITSLDLHGQKPPYRLVITLGDPDMAQYLIWERVGEASGQAPAVAPQPADSERGAAPQLDGSHSSGRDADDSINLDDAPRS